MMLSAGREKERIAFNYLTSQKYSGEKAVLKVLREGLEVQVTVKLMRPSLLVPLHLDNQDPSFFVVAGQHCPLAHSPAHPLVCLKASKRSGCICRHQFHETLSDILDCPIRLYACRVRPSPNT